MSADSAVEALRAQITAHEEDIARVERALEQHEAKRNELRAMLADHRGKRERLVKAIALITGAATARKTGPEQCPECERSLPNKQGLALHRKAAHGVAPKSAAKAKPASPAAPAAAAPSAGTPTAAAARADVVLACEDCPAEFDTADKIMRHCRTEHGRAAYASERRPVRAA